MLPRPPALNAAASPTPPARFLWNGSYSVLVTAAGTGASTLGGLALTQWRGDGVEDGDGLFIYVRERGNRTYWSLGSTPAGRRGERYEARSLPGVFTIVREDHGIESRLEICVPPDAECELRRLTMWNRSARRRRMEITSYAEVVLADPLAYAAHPVFSKLFLETEFVPAQRSLLVRRRPRATGDAHPWLVHALIGEGDLEHETDRRRFIGRGRGLERPAALAGDTLLTGTTGSVLDPIVSLRSTADLAPGAQVQATFVLGAAGDRGAALALAARWNRAGAVGAAFDAGRVHAGSELERLATSADEAEYMQALAGAILYAYPALRARPQILARVRGNLDALARHGLPARRPLAVLDATEERGARLLPDLLRTQRFWLAAGLPIDVAIVTGDPAALASTAAAAAGHLHVLDARDLPPADRDVIAAAARLVLTTDFPTLSAAPSPVAATPLRIEATAAPTPAGRPEVERESLRFANGYGGFSVDGSEYVIRLTWQHESGLRLPPRPWINVIANERFGFLVSETGAGCTWSGNSREHRLTPWANDPLLDPHDEALYIRDEETGAFWSPLPGPSPAAADYETRHGFGYSTYRVHATGLEQETTLFVPPEDPVKIATLRLRNTERRRRRLTLVTYRRLVLGTSPEASGRFVVTAGDEALPAVFAWNPLAGEFGAEVAFSALVTSRTHATHHTGDRSAFLGRGGSTARPAALRPGAVLDDHTGAGLDPCFAQQVMIELSPEASIDVHLLLGEGRDMATARSLIARYAVPGAVAAALAAAREAWRRRCTAITVTTPSPALDLLVNGWLPYQTLSCRLWGRSAMYQSGGAFGFRDQLQDAAALVYHWPALTRAQILLHAGHQFTEGDVLHWWHPPRSRGIRTRCSDDLLWLPFVTASYIGTTGDRDILDERVRFVSARPLASGDDEAFVTPEEAAETANLYTHCCRAIDRGLTRGRHNLPLFGTCDWNDGMNRVGRGGKGESIWLGFFICAVLESFIPICIERGDPDRARRYRGRREELIAALNDAGWDGDWYRRGYYDGGEPLGSRSSDECRIDALVQAWAVISGAAPPARARRALDAVEKHLVSEKERLIRLLAPPFERTPLDPGYIRGYVPGARENGGQYTHAALWVVRALAELGRNERAAVLLDMLNPILHADTSERAQVYQAEPYVIAADIHSVPPHVGRAGWSWYTGSAGWMLRVALESILGFRLVAGKNLVLKPCVPRSWRGFRITYSPPGEETHYEIIATNPEGAGANVIAAALDGKPVPVAAGAVTLPLVADGARHQIELVLGVTAAPAP